MLIVDPDIEATVAGSFENTSNAGFNVLVILNSGPAPAARTVEPGDSFTFVYNDVSRIALFALVEGERYTGIFKYQLTYTFDVQ
ncbi:hypothetical protein RCG23_03640 [Neobacillus sp. PS3-34]|uniref:hypothetical protein n=1 Tax=Neobacillus sp. PS3-34 TaxID=3070678 RepID=UPI0027E0B9B6|nr:hypothetical protein [Neobacillus sp. PS3-34]WML49194.1 hypothetical protein RCG23_03640 [Neobacillus sp. PS3-34]